MPFISFDLTAPQMRINLNNNINFTELSLLDFATDEMLLTDSSLNTLILTINDYNQGTHCFLDRGRATNYFASIHGYHNQDFSYSKRAGEAPCYKSQDLRRTSNLDITVRTPDGTIISDAVWNNSKFHIKLYIN